MKFEQDLVREPVEPLPEGVTRRPAGDARRDIRLLTDSLIHEALRANTLPPLVDGTCIVMLALARALNRHELVPEVPHFIEAAIALIEDARTVYDKGMLVDDADRAMVGAVMLEITVRGVCAALSIDYEAEMRKRVQPPETPPHEIH